MGRILVTGANGFIGRHLCRRLARDGAAVVAAVRRADAPDIDGIAARAVGDIGPGTDWTPLLAGVEAVVHCAARVHVLKESEPDPLAAFRKVNVAGTVRLAGQAAEAGVDRFVFLSSIGARTAEAAAARGAAAGPYQQSKWEAEQALTSITAESGMATVILRPPLVYGPGAPGNFRQLRRAIVRGWPLPLRSIDNRRSLIFVENLTSAILTCLSHPQAPGHVFAVSDGEAVSTPRLVGLMAQALGRPARLLPCPPALLRLALRLLRPGGAVEGLFETLEIDNEEIHERTGWRPPFALPEALARSLAD
jgi:nucleoside-diphosphate-sugar epimerase